MWVRRVAFAVVIGAGVVSCARQSSSGGSAMAQTSRPGLDDLCRDAEPAGPGVRVDTFQVGSALVPIEKGWFTEPRISSHQLILSQGVRGQIQISHGLQRPWPRIQAPAGIECEIVRGIDTIMLRGRIESGLRFSVEAMWEKPSDKTQLWLYALTGLPAELKRIRRTIQDVQFPVPDSVAVAGK
jgi:hypothetical protein